jgi:phosphoribosylformimino-5-aminoimidazole carboxamide ribotide isomerase
MIIFPAIDLRQGKCVRLYQGKFEKAEIVGEDPVNVAADFKRKGAEYIHIVDLDGAQNGKMENLNCIYHIIKSVDIPIELGGGIRNMNTLDMLIKAGVARVILGTAALENTDLVKAAVIKYGDKIAVGIDAKNKKVAANGWVNVSGVDYIDFAKKVENMGISTIIFTDISKDGTLKGPNLQQLNEINSSVHCRIIASGGIKNIDDLTAINEMGIYGAIVGKGIYSGKIDLQKAIISCKSKNKEGDFK